MQDKQITINLSTFIIIAVIICAFILGGIAYYIYDKSQNTKSTNLQENQETSLQNPSQSNLANSGNTSNNNTNLNNNNAGNSSTTFSGNSNTTVTDVQENNSFSTNSSQAQSSTKNSPLSIGQWGLVSKRVSGNYIDVPIRITNVVRGNSASQVVKDYCNSGSTIYKYSEPEEDMEWAVIEYEIDLTSVNSTTSINANAQVTGTGNNSAIKYNNKSYISSVINMTNESTKSEIATASFAAQLPIGCTDYLIVFGLSSNTQAFFLGK